MKKNKKIEEKKLISFDKLKEKACFSKLQKFIENVLNKIKNIANNHYWGYNTRLAFFGVMFILVIGLSFLTLFKSFNIEDESVIGYQENGSSDYKVYLKENDFYEVPYLGKNMYYIASLIKNIDISYNYNFLINDVADLDFKYSIMAKLSIADQSGKNTYYTKEYVLKPEQTKTISAGNAYSLNESMSIDYDYYNNVANNFKMTYGIDASSTLTVYLKVNKVVTKDGKQLSVNSSSNTSVTIPLSQKALEINLNDKGLNNSGNIINESSVTVSSTFLIILSIGLFVGSVALLLRFLELLFVLGKKDSAYEKEIKKILREYDRLIVETPTTPDLTLADIVKIKVFQELVDARDNLKLPIMYHKLNNEKCYFYIRHGETLYLMTIKATDYEEKK